MYYLKFKSKGEWVRAVGGHADFRKAVGLADLATTSRGGPKLLRIVDDANNVIAVLRREKRRKGCGWLLVKNERGVWGRYGRPTEEYEREAEAEAVAEDLRLLGYEVIIVFAVLV